jgi:PAS domain S-box-containing protein
MTGRLIEKSRNATFQLAAVTFLTILTVILTLFSLSNGVTIVFTHFYYIPIILAAYWYRFKGVLYTLSLAAFYLLSFALLITPSALEIIAALTRVIVFIGIAVVIRYLSVLIDNEKSALRKSEERFRNVWESIQAGIFLIDGTTHRIVAANPEAEKMTGYTAAEMTGRLCHQFICPAEEGACPISDLGQTIDRVERVLITREGKSIPILKSARMMKSNGNNLLLENMIDISAVKEAEQALIAYIREAALRVKNPVELVRDDLAGIRERFSADAISRESLLLELRVQEKNIEGIQQNLRELDTAIAEQRTEIPDALKEYLSR